MGKRVVPAAKPTINAPVNIELLGQFVRYKRTSLNMTLEDAASLSGLSKQAYNNVELGLANVRVNTLFKVIDALGIKLAVIEQQDSDDWI